MDDVWTSRLHTKSTFMRLGAVRLLNKAIFPLLSLSPHQRESETERGDREGPIHKQPGVENPRLRADTLAWVTLGGFSIVRPAFHGGCSKVRDHYQSLLLLFTSRQGWAGGDLSLPPPTPSFLLLLPLLLGIFALKKTTTQKDQERCGYAEAGAPAF